MITCPSCARLQKAQVRPPTAGGWTVPARRRGRGDAVAHAEVLASVEAAGVAIFDRDEAMATRTAKEIVAYGGLAAVYAVDLTDTSATHAALDAVEADLGPVDVLVNNVGWNG